MSETITTTDIALAMRQYGGGFASALGEALLHADEVNEAKIKATWPDLWGQYMTFARKMKERKAEQSL